MPQHSAHISLMAAGELRDAVAAARRGDQATALYGLMSIDPESWSAIQQRLTACGATVGDLLHDVPKHDAP